MTVDLTIFTQRALENAYDDWRAGTGEHDQSKGGRLAAIFNDSGWSRSGVTYQQGGKVHDWCGMSACAWYYRSGMHPSLRRSFYHTFGLEAFATYGRQRNVNPKRLMSQVKVGDAWISVEEWHRREGQPRLWIPESVLRAGDPKDLDLRQGDILLIDYQGVWDTKPDEAVDEADHITLVAGPPAEHDGVLEVMNGNASGLSHEGKPVSDAVARTLHNLNDAKARKRLYGAIRLSPLDFDLSVEYRP